MRSFGVLVQFCLAHLIRDVKDLTTLPDKVTQNYGNRLLEKLRNLFNVIHRQEKMTPAAFQRALERARDDLIKTAKRAPPRPACRVGGASGPGGVPARSAAGEGRVRTRARARWCALFRRRPVAIGFPFQEVPMVKEGLAQWPTMIHTRPMYGARSLMAEHSSWRLHRELRGRDFEDHAALQRFIGAQRDGLLDRLPADADPADRAQELFYLSREADAPWAARRLLRAAHEADPDNVDVRVDLARDEPDRSRRLELLEEALALGQAAFPPEEEFGADEGGLWPYLPARPGLRAHAALALEQLHAGRLRDAIASCERLLERNPADNQGARYMHFALLLEVGRFEAAERARATHAQEPSALFAWGGVLLGLETGGDAAAALEVARSLNHEVERLLLRPEWIDGPPEAGAAGSLEEADIVADLLWRAWHRRPRSVEWLQNHACEPDLRAARKRPVWEEILEADEEGLRPGLLPFLQPVDEETIARLWQLVRAGPDESDLYIAEGAIELIDGLGHAGSGVEELIAYLERYTRLEPWGPSGAVRSLAGVGVPAVQPLLEACAAARDPDVRYAFAEVLVGTGVRSEEIFQVLVEQLDEGHALGPALFLDYGDPAALPLLSARLDAADPAPERSTPSEAAELVDAIAQLGGSFSPSQEERFAKYIEAQARWAGAEGQAELEALMTEILERESAPAPERPSRGEPLRPFFGGHEPVGRFSEPPLSRRRRPGRNEPCWCDSGRKYKRCHLSEDEAEER